MKTPATLIIMDGYGLAAPSPGNAIAAAATPVLDELYKTCPNTTLSASGSDVGLPVGQIGNSEVGHTNIGAGRIVYQELLMISREIESGIFFKNETLLSALDACKQSGGALHLMGLVSPGGVHSHEKHLWALLELAKMRGLTQVYIHCFTDGRDVFPNSGKTSIEACVQKCRETGTGSVATVCGRYYAMDREDVWERVEAAYNAMVLSEGEYDPDPVHAVQSSYDAGITDEFIKPVVCDKNGAVKRGDTVIFFNFRPDRAREITRVFTDLEFSHFKRKNGYIPVSFVCMTQYDETITNAAVVYPQEPVRQTLGETISGLGLTQLRIAETTKYAHVTFFLNGGVERPFPGEERILIPTPTQFPTYDLIPEMSARKVAETACREILSGTHDIVIINFANCDMVGHTGDFGAAVKAVETVDECVGKVRDAVSQMGGFLIVTADHGNAEIMLAADGASRHTAHSTNPVPFILSGANVALRPGKLCDIAPTLLELMGLEKPEVMTGQSLIKAPVSNYSYL